jgi:hypothetical protein
VALAIGPWPEANSAEDSAVLHFALAFGDKVQLRSVSIAGHPEILLARAAKQALNWLRLSLLGRTLT